MRRPRTSGNRFENGMAGSETGLLRDKRQAQIGLAPDHAIIGVNLAGNHFQQAGFASAIAADQANAFGFVDDQGSAVEQRPMAKSEGNVI
jgi:hypothetical protein